MNISKLLCVISVSLLLSGNITASSYTQDNSIEGEKDKTASVEETINSIFEPAVGFLYTIFFWDPFSAVGIYDPIVYTEDGEIHLPSDSKKTGSISVTKGSSTIRGEKSKFTKDYKLGDELAFGNEVHVIRKITNDQVIELEEPARSSSSELTHGTPSRKNIPLIVVWLFFGAVFFTIRMKFINLKGAKHAIDLIRGKYSKKSDKGDISHFQALTTALSATVGLGNIASVAVAISVGGPGATFWIVVMGLLGMTLKFTECTLGLKYRKINKDGEVSGGPMYYLSQGLAKYNLPKLGSSLSYVYAFICVFASIAGGCMFQSNQAFQQFAGEIPFLEDKGAYFGLIMAIMVGVVIIGGVKSIANVTSKIVPFMAAIYVLAALAILGIHIMDIPKAIGLILSGAFDADAIRGGFIGVLIIGLQRAAFSNEAGLGSSSIAHSAAKTKEPISEGSVALLEPFVDTVVICTLTSLIIIITGQYENTSLSGAQLTSSAFESVISWFPTVLTFAILLFAYSTMISWSYYGVKAWSYIVGEGKKRANIFRLIFVLCAVVGSSSSLGAVIDFSDLALLALGFPNIIGLLILSKEVVRDKNAYYKKVKEKKLI